MAVNKNQEAKDYVENKLAAVFGSDFVGNIGGKVYVWGKTKAGEKIQVAISMTCPKTAVTAVDGPSTGFDWADNPTTAAPIPKAPTEITEDEKQNIANLLASLGL